MKVNAPIYLYIKFQMLYDTHAHVNFTAYKEDAEEVVKRALQAGVWINNVGTQIDTSRQAIELAEKFQISNNKSQINSKSQNTKAQTGIFAVIGLHPVHTYSQHLDEEETSFKSREEVFDYQAYKKLAQSHKVVGIGECGLDYYRLPADGDREAIKILQRDAFIGQIRLAKELNKALVIHCRPSKDSQDAYEDILQILDEEFGESNVKEPALSLSKGQMSNVRFEIHSFTGSPEIVQEFVKRGAYVGFNGIITFDKTGEMKKNVETVPLDRIILETDSPYLTPTPHRGHRNEPSYVKFVAEKVAEIKNVSAKEVEDTTFQNARKLFNV